MIKKLRERLEIGDTICVDGVWYEAVPQRKRYTCNGCVLDAFEHEYACLNMFCDMNDVILKKVED